MTNLLKRLKAHDQEAFEELFLSQKSKIEGLCYKILGNSADAEDCTQKTFIQAWRKIDQFNGLSSLSTWLSRVAINECYMLLRNSKFKVSRTVALEDLGKPIKNLSYNHKAIILRPELNEAIRALPKGYRQAFLLHFDLGLNHEEVGKALGIAEGTSKSQTYHGRQALRKALKNDQH